MRGLDTEYCIMKTILRLTQLGIVSYGTECGHPDYPGVYTRITSVLGWIAGSIEDTLWGSDCQPVTYSDGTIGIEFHKSRFIIPNFSDSHFLGSK